MCSKCEKNNEVRPHYSKDETFAKKNQYHIPLPSGPENIMYGEKVIQVRNDSNQYHYPKGIYSGYVANGEI